MTPKGGIYRLVLGYEDESLARACLESAMSICLAAAAGKEFNVPGEMLRLRELGYETRLGPSTRSMVEAAKKRGIPAIRLSEGNLVQLGFGARQRRILAAETDRTSAVGETVAQDKELTRSLLRKIGVPVSAGQSPTSASHAWEIACEIGLPVVVKPRYGSHGRGVATNLSTRAQIAAACEAIRREGSEIVVERFIPGADHRLLVVGNRLVAAAIHRGLSETAFIRWQSWSKPLMPTRGEVQATEHRSPSWCWTPSPWRRSPSKGFCRKRCRRKARAC
ncbi:MAG TPA: hypothetical protein VNH11_25500 [Pirellulales bacterium]|nr:hypothetical protein [Pirellulales bacterium]